MESGITQLAEQALRTCCICLWHATSLTKILPITPQQALVTINDHTRLATAAAIQSLH